MSQLNSDKLKYEKCSNCELDIAEDKYFLHEAYCSRKLKKCQNCKEMIEVDLFDQHNQNHLNEQIQEKCEHCKISFRKNDLIKHQLDCKRKPQLCNFCDIKILFDEYQDHIDQCGSRTKQCEMCDQNVILKEYDIHIQICGIPDLCQKIEKNYGKKQINGNEKFKKELKKYESTSEQDGSFDIDQYELDDQYEIDNFVVEDEDDEFEGELPKKQCSQRGRKKQEQNKEQQKQIQNKLRPRKIQNYKDSDENELNEQSKEEQRQIYKSKETRNTRKKIMVLDSDQEESNQNVVQNQNSNRQANPKNLNNSKKQNNSVNSKSQPQQIVIDEDSYDNINDDDEELRQAILLSLMDQDNKTQKQNNQPNKQNQKGSKNLHR